MFGSKFFKLSSVLIAIFVISHAKSYKGFKVVTFRIETDEQLKEIQSLQGEPGVRKS